MALYEVDGCLLTMEEIDQRFKELRDKLAKAQEELDYYKKKYANLEAGTLRFIDEYKPDEKALGGE